MLDIASFAWVPNDGPLVIDVTSFATGSEQTIGSLYFPKLDIEVTFEATPTPPNGNPFYESLAGTNLPQTIPMPAGTVTVTLSAAGSGTYYVWASSGLFRPLMEGPISS